LNPSGKQALAGSAWAVCAISIWAAWMVITRMDLLSSGLDEFDITAIRFATASLILSPVVARQGIVAKSVGFGVTLLLAACAGAPYVLIASAGLTMAPASDAGPLTPGVMPLFAALLSAMFLKERIGRSRLFGLGLIPVGVALVAGTSIASGQPDRWIGDLLFMLAAFFWAVFTVTMRRGRVPSMHGAALVAAWSAVLYLPIYAFFLMRTPWHTGWATILQQVIFQGVLTSVVSLVAFNKAIGILGASRSAVFASLVPALATLLAVPLLHEQPTALQFIGIGVITLGVLFGSDAITLRLRRDPFSGSDQGENA